MSAFEWIDEIPDGWEPPVDLLGPSQDVVANLAIKMLTCDYLGHQVLVLVGRFIAEHSLFTMWFLREGKAAVGAREALLLTLLPMEQVRIVYEAWQYFERVPVVANSDEEAVRLGERRGQARLGLENALQSAIDAFRYAPGRNVD
ncbi:hypothetical protein [Kutzneria kofuensis]|uniref:Uncharacterized protein n=1 Tax=Kutzneria kofuensis TaxID=103725 RepID=A0A7W9KMZ9_9PSEU|nr:hypothetical protein [Kutzneria kofuensis]MBB5895278.1 hypothetical protein [Kutzneria kofuensis]